MGIVVELQMGPQLQIRESTAAREARLRDLLGDDWLLTREEAAVFLRVNVRTLDAWAGNTAGKRRRAVTIKRGDGTQSRIQAADVRIPFRRVGHGVRFRLGDLKRFIAHGTNGITA